MRSASTRQTCFTRFSDRIIVIGIAALMWTMMACGCGTEQESGQILPGYYKDQPPPVYEYLPPLP